MLFTSPTLTVLPSDPLTADRKWPLHPMADTRFHSTWNSQAVMNVETAKRGVCGFAD